MKYNKFLLAAAVLFLLAVTTQAQDKKEATGKDIFQNLKCGMCHSIDSEKLATKGKGGDLSNVGADKKADWISKFMKKEVKLNDKTHTMPFKGTDAELTTLSTWLASLKKPAK